MAQGPREMLLIARGVSIWNGVERHRSTRAILRLSLPNQNSRSQNPWVLGFKHGTYFTTAEALFGKSDTFSPVRPTEY